MGKKKRCARCGGTVHGFSDKGSKTEKRPSRPMPELCSKCLRRRLIEIARGEK